MTTPQRGLPCPYHGADRGVVELDPGLDHLGDEVVLPPALLAGALGPTADLAVVVGRAAALKNKSRLTIADSVITTNVWTFFRRLA